MGKDLEGICQGFLNDYRTLAIDSRQGLIAGLPGIIESVRAQANTLVTGAIEAGCADVKANQIGGGKSDQSVPAIMGRIGATEPMMIRNQDTGTSDGKGPGRAQQAYAPTVMATAPYRTP